MQLNKYINKIWCVMLLSIGIFCISQEANAQNCTTALQPMSVTAVQGPASGIPITPPGTLVESSTITVTWDPQCGTRAGDGCEFGDGNSLFWYVGLYGQNAPVPNGVDRECGSTAVTLDCPAVAPTVGLVVNNGGDYNGICLAPKAATCTSQEFSQRRPDDPVTGEITSWHTFGDDGTGMLGACDGGPLSMTLPVCPGQCYNVVVWEFVIDQPSGTGPNADGGAGGTGNLLPFPGMDANISCGNMTLLSESPPSEVISICIDAADNSDNAMIQNPTLTLTNSVNGDPALSVCDALNNAPYTGTFQGQPEDIGDPTLADPCEASNVDQGIPMINNIGDPLLSDGSVDQAFGGTGNAGDAGDLSVVLGGAGNSANGQLGLGAHVVEVNCRENMGIVFSTPEGCKGFTDQSQFGLPACDFSDGTLLSTNAKVYVTVNGTPIPGVPVEPYPACYAGGSGTGTCPTNSATGYGANYTAQFGNFISSDDVNDPCITNLVGNPFEGSGTNPFTLPGTLSGIDFGDGVARDVSTVCVTYEDPCDGSNSVTCVKFISDAPPIDAQIAACSETCSGDSDGQIIVYDIIGGSADANSDGDYTDGNGGGYSVTVVSGPATPTFTQTPSTNTWTTPNNLPPGVYVVEVRDNLAPNDTFLDAADDATASCGAACPIQLTIAVGPGAVPSAAVENVVAVSCSGPGTATLAIDRQTINFLPAQEFCTAEGELDGFAALGSAVSPSGNASPLFVNPTVTGFNNGCTGADLEIDATTVGLVCFEGIDQTAGNPNDAMQFFLEAPDGSFIFFALGSAFGSGQGDVTGNVCFSFGQDAAFNTLTGPINGSWFAGFFDGYTTAVTTATNICLTLNNKECVFDEDITAFCSQAAADQGDMAGGISSADQTVIWTSTSPDENAAEPFNFLTFPNAATDGETTVSFDNDAAAAAGVAAGTQICYDAQAFVPGNNFASNVITDISGEMTDCYVGACCEVTEQVCFTVVDCRTCPTAGDVLAQPSPICAGSCFDLSLIVAQDSEEDGIPDVDANGDVIPVDPASYTEGVDYYIEWDVSTDGGATWAAIFDGDPYGAAQTGGAAFQYCPSLAPVSGCTPDDYLFRAAVACLLPGEPFTPAGLPLVYNGSFAFTNGCDAIAGGDPSVNCITYTFPPEIPPCAEITTYTITGDGTTTGYSPSWPSEMNISIIDPSGACTNVFNGAASGLPNATGPFAFSDVDNASLAGAPASGSLSVCFFDDFADIPDGQIDNVTIQVDYQVPPGCDVASFDPALDPVTNAPLTGVVCTTPILNVDYSLPDVGCDPNITLLCTPYAGAYDPATGMGAVDGEPGALVLYSTDGGTTYTSTDPYDAVSITATDDSDRTDLVVEYQIIVPGCPDACNMVTGTFTLMYPDAPTGMGYSICEGGTIGAGEGLTATCAACPMPAPLACVESVNLTDNGAAASPFGGTDNSNYHSYTGTCSDANLNADADAHTLTIDVVGYDPNANGTSGLSGDGCTDECGVPLSSAGESFWVTVVVDGAIVYDDNYDQAGAYPGPFGSGAGQALPITFTEADFTFSQGSQIDVYVYPNCFAGCGSLTGGVQYQDEWDALTLTSFTAEFSGAAPAPPASSLTWWDAATGGTQQGATGASPLDPTGLTAADFDGNATATPFDINTPGDYTFYAQCDCAGCASLRTPLVVTVFENPTVNPMGGAACEGQGGVTLTSGPSGGDITSGDYTYTWAGPNGQAETTEDVVLNPVAATDAGTWNVTITDDNGCTATGSTTVTVNAPPTIAPTANTPCDGQQDLMIMGNPTGGTAPYTFVWAGPSGQAPTDENPTVSPGTNAADEGTWNVTVTDSNGCTGTGSVIVTINDLPAAPVGVGYAVCELGTVVGGIEATGCNGTINWFLDATGGTSVGTGTPFDATTASSGAADLATPGAYTYYAECTDANGCIGPRTPVVFEVYSLPIITLVETFCRPADGGDYDATVNIDLGTYPDPAGLTITATSGTPIPSTLSVNGTVVVEDVPAFTDVTVTATTGLGCTTSLLVEHPDCCPMDVGYFTSEEDQCIDGTAPPTLPSYADVYATVDLTVNAQAGWVDLTTGMTYLDPELPPAPVYTGDGCTPQEFPYELHIYCTVDATVDLYGGSHQITVWPIPTATETDDNCIFSISNDCPNGYILYDNDGDGVYSDPLPADVVPDGDVTISYYASIPGAPVDCGLYDDLLVSCECRIDHIVWTHYEGNTGSVGPFYYNQVDIDVFEGILPYTWEWEAVGYVRNARINTDDTTPHPNGNYEYTVIYSDNAYWSVTVTDHVGCQIVATNDPTAGVGGDEEILDISAKETVEDNCLTRGLGQGEGSITIYPEHGTPPYNYVWTGPFTWQNNQSPYAPGNANAIPWTDGNGSMGEEFFIDELPYGWYAVTITDSGIAPGDPALIDDGNGNLYIDVAGEQVWMFHPDGNPVIDNDPATPLPQQITESWYWIECKRPSGRGKVDFDNSTITAYPNPFADETTIEFSHTQAEEVTVEVFTMTGQQVVRLYNGTVEANTAYNIEFDAGPLPSGVYLMELRTESGEVTHEKLVITK